MAVSTMGMENLATSFQTARTGTTGALDGASAQPFWVHEAFLDYAFNKTNSAKVGRMELDTPLLYTENWNATANAFEALTATNTDLPNTTITAAYVAKGNGAQKNLMSAPQVFGAEATFNNIMGFAANKTVTTPTDVRDSNGTIIGSFDTNTTTTEKISDGGVLMLGGVNKSVGFMPLQAWGYVSPDSAQAFWLQADATAKDLGVINATTLTLIGAGIGLQGKSADWIKDAKVNTTHDDTKMTTSLAANLGASAGMFNAFAAYSSNSKGNLPVANIATNYKKTKLPTASIFNDGMVVAQPDTNTWKVGAGAKFEGIGALTVSYGSSAVGQNEGYQNTGQNVGGPASMGYIVQNILKQDIDVNELDIIFTTKIKDVDLAAMYMKVNNTYVPILGADGGGAPAASPGGPSQGFIDYGTFANDIVRIVATLKF